MEDVNESAGVGEIGNMEQVVDIKSVAWKKYLRLKNTDYD